MSSQPVLWEPSYAQHESLQRLIAEVQTDLAPLLIIGVGPVGRLVLEKLTPCLPIDPQTGERTVKLLYIGINHDVERILQMPVTDKPLLQQQEVLADNHAAFANANRESPRSDIRTLILEDVRNSPPAVWEKFHHILGQIPKRDVWLVGSLFDPVSNGLVFDLSHLLRLVSRGQRIENMFIGWMLALPTPDWGSDYLAEAGATLREFTRLKTNLPRLYDYRHSRHEPSRESALVEHIESGNEDIDALLLCSPQKGMLGKQAAEYVAAQMSQALLALLQPEAWRQFLTHWRELGSSRFNNTEPVVSLLGTYADHIPYPELKAAVRSRIAYDVLFDRHRGLIPVRRLSPGRADEDMVLKILRDTGHPFLISIADAHGSYHSKGAWPHNAGAKHALLVTIAKKLQEIVDNSDGYGEPLEDCVAILVGLETVLKRSRASKELTEDLLEALSASQKEFESWTKWGRTLLEKTGQYQSKANNDWENAITRIGWTSPAATSAINDKYAHFGEGFSTNPVVIRIRQNVRWAWSVQGDRLQLRLDTLYPKWRDARKKWQFRPSDDVHELWQSILSVVTALTEEEQYWKIHLTPTSNQVVVLPSYDTDLATKVSVPRRVGYRVSADASWRNQIPTIPGVDLAHASAHSGGWGISLVIHHLIPLRAVNYAANAEQKYLMRRGQGQKIHIFHAEQKAATIENSMLNKLPRRQRVEFGTLQLSAQTIADLQWPDYVQLFVQAWRYGFVQNDAQTNKIVLRLRQDDSIIWQSPGNCHHLIDALHEFVKESYLAASRIDHTVLRQMVHTAARTSQPTNSLDSQALASFDQRDAQWALLVMGINTGEH
jgi:hypothetical protein